MELENDHECKDDFDVRIDLLSDTLMTMMECSDETDLVKTMAIMHFITEYFKEEPPDEVLSCLSRIFMLTQYFGAEIPDARRLT